MDAQREWLEKDFYKILGVEKTATAKELSKAYRTLARQYHPDANQGDAAAEERFKEISAAYEVLGDEKARRRYDEFRRYGGGANFGGGYGTGGARGGAQDLGDLSDLLGGLFGGARGGQRGGFGFGQMPGLDLQASLHLSFEESIKGVTKSVRLSSEALSAPMEVNVRIPAGVKNGQRIRVPGKGAPSREGGEPGDLLVTISIEQDKTFERDGNNLRVQIPITYSEAVLGADIKVPTMSGTTVTVRVPPGTSSGKVLRVRGRGVKTSSQTGDLLVSVVVHVPKSVSDEEMTLIEKLHVIEKPAPRS